MNEIGPRLVARSLGGCSALAQCCSPVRSSWRVPSRFRLGPSSDVYKRQAHGAADGAVYNGPEPEGATFAEQGLGWKNSYGVGNAGDSISSGLEGAWTPSPIKWDNSYFDTLFGHEWVQSQSPAGATQWVPKDGGGANTVPDAHDLSLIHI